MACLLNSYSRKRMAMRILIDVSCIATVAIGIFVIQFGVEPYNRGFFCDDESIKHPVLSDTISVPLAVVVGLVVPISLIISIERILNNVDKKFCMVSKNASVQRNSWLIASYGYIVVFLFGLSVNQFLTEVGKVSVGRLRPHFLTLCAPDFSKIQDECRNGYVTNAICTSTDSAKLKEARLSFPSGHSSFTMYCMLYSMLYLQARVSCKSAILLKPFVLLLLFSMAFYTCLSRISDYMHHWSDVLAGAILGIVVCVCVVKGLTDFGPSLCAVRLKEINRNVELGSIPNRVKTDTMTSDLGSPSVEDMRDGSHVVNIDSVDY